MTIRIQPLGDVRTRLGECPIWDAQQELLWLVDGREGRIMALDPESGAVRRELKLEPPLGSIALNDDGRLVVARRRDIVLADLDSGEVEILAALERNHPNLRLNDGTALPDGGFLVGTMHVFRDASEPPLGGLYRVGLDGTAVKLAGGIGVTNGPNVGPDGRLYVCDSAARHLLRFTVSPDFELGSPEVFAMTDELGSAPDGCMFDSEGVLWTALVHAGTLAGFDANGSLAGRIKLPVTHPASLCMGGAQGDVLFVTTISNSGRLTAEGPLDGTVLRVTGTGLHGSPARRCRIRAARSAHIIIPDNLPDCGAALPKTGP